MRLLIAFLSTFAIAAAASACSLCSNPINRATLGEEMDTAAVVAVGLLSNPRLNPASVAGTGTTDFTIEKLIKTDGSLGDAKQMTIARYMPVPDPKQPPRFLIFFEKSADRLEPLQGFAVKSPALLAYLEGAKEARRQGRVPGLIYYARHLDHADEHVALDAFMEFAKSKDDDVFKAAKQLDPALVRRLLAKSTLDADRLSLFAFLLGCCGQDRDADDLLKTLPTLTGERRTAMDGVMAGYISLRPKDGWQKLAAVLGDAKQPFATRFAAVRTVRMLQGCHGSAIKPDVLAAYRNVIRDGDLADLCVEDLRRWQWWDLTSDIAAQFGKPSHSAPIVQHCLIRYAMSCPLPEARTIVARARQIDPEYVDDLEKAKQ